ncbi:MAG: MFS transporter [Dethiobacter sp.]|jgi:MFS family permease|nr:MAG: MFS transporter [Dethiobacter sp.]
MQPGKIETQTAVQFQKVKPQLWTWNFILLFLSSLTVFLCFHSLIPTLPAYIERFGGTTKTAGLAIASLTLAAVMVRPFAGWALDKFGRKLIFLVGLFVFLIPSIIYIWMIPVVLLIVFRFIQGLGWGVCNTASPTVASDIVPPERLGEGMGFFSTTLSFSLAIAPAAGLWLIDRYSFQVLFIACSLLTLASLLLASLVRYPKMEKQETGFNLVFMEKAALRPAMVILFVTLTYSSFLSFLALYTREQGMTSTGLFFTTLAVTTLISRPVAGRIIDRRGRKGYDLSVLTGSITIIIAMLILARISTPLHLVAGGVFFGIGFGFIQPTMLALAISSVPSGKRGAANATYWTAFDIGVAVGSMTWGLVATALGYSTMFNLTIIPTLIALLLYFWMKRDLKHGITW